MIYLVVKLSLSSSYTQFLSYIFKSIVKYLHMHCKDIFECTLFCLSIMCYIYIRTYIYIYISKRIMFVIWGYKVHVFVRVFTLWFKHPHRNVKHSQIWKCIGNFTILETWTRQCKVIVKILGNKSRTVQLFCMSLLLSGKA